MLATLSHDFMIETKQEVKAASQLMRNELTCGTNFDLIEVTDDAGSGVVVDFIVVVVVAAVVGAGVDCAPVAGVVDRSPGSVGSLSPGSVGSAAGGLQVCRREPNQTTE